MDISKGYLRLFRQMLEWEWYDNPNTKAIFIHCLLKANDKAKDWRDLKIKRGQFVTSLEKLATANGLTVRQTRTALKNLQMTQEIDIQTTSRYSIITVKNYNLYQANDKVKRQANDIQTSCKMTTTNNNIDIDNNIISSSSIDEFLNSISKEEEEELRKISKENGIKNFRPWLRRLISNGDIKDNLIKANKRIQWRNKKLESATAKIEETQEPQEVTEQGHSKAKAAFEKLKKIRR